MPAPSHRAHAGVMERRHQAATLYLQGEQQYEIARRLGVSQQQISFDLKAVREAWLASMIRDFDTAKAQELAKIDAAEVEYWAGWQRSYQPREVTLTEATEGGEVSGEDGKARAKAPIRKASVRREGQAGDPRFLDGVLKCVERRCAILGLGVEAEALKEASTGLASLLSLAKGSPSLGVSAPMAEA